MKSLQSIEEFEALKGKGHIYFYSQPTGAEIVGS